MALIKCGECGAEISDKASFCVKCGCPVTDMYSQAEPSTTFEYPSIEIETNESGDIFAMIVPAEMVDYTVNGGTFKCQLYPTEFNRLYFHPLYVTSRGKKKFTVDLLENDKNRPIAIASKSTSLLLDSRYDNEKRIIALGPVKAPLKLLKNVKYLQFLITKELREEVANAKTNFIFNMNLISPEPYIPVSQEDQIQCPKCRSTQIVAKTQGFGVGKAVTGAVLLGPVGALGGAIGSSKTVLVCMKCGHQWSPTLKSEKKNNVLEEMQKKEVEEFVASRKKNK